MKHAEKLVKEGGSESRPVLQGVNHSKDGTLSVTNAHYGYLAKNVNAPTDVVIHAVTGEVIDKGVYPDLERLFSSLDDAEVTFNISSVSRLIEIVQAMQYSISKGISRRNTQLELVDNTIKVTDTNNQDPNINFSYKIHQDSTVRVARTIFNSQYFLNTLELFKDQGYEDVNIHWYGPMRPFIIAPAQYDPNLQAIITPVRAF